MCISKGRPIQLYEGYILYEVWFMLYIVVISELWLEWVGCGHK